MFKNLNKFQIFILVTLFILVVFLRFWQIRDYVVFLGDEGRDMMIMKKMITTMRPVFLGPTASVGGFYLGPIYYWMGAPFLALTRFDPVGPSIMVAIFGVATVTLLYKFLKEAVGFYPAVIASLLYATAPLIVRYSRSSWNPNPLPFFALLIMYCIYRAKRKENLKYFLLAGASFGVAIQLHYLSVMLVLIAALIVFLNFNLKSTFKIIALSLIGAFITFSPFFLFELKHNFPNFHTIFEFVTRPTTHGYKSLNFIEFIPTFGNIFIEHVTALKGTIITRIIFFILSFGALIAFAKFYKEKEKKLYLSIGLLWFLGGLFALKFYSGQIFDYYFGFMFPAPFFLLGTLIGIIWKKLYVKIAIVILTAISVSWFLNNEFYKSLPNRLINQTEDVAKFVIDKSDGKPFNFALISQNNSDHGYRYFLEVNGHNPTELETMITDQLLVVCESKKCAPLGHPSWEIAGFGRGEIVGEWELPEIGIKVIRLIHWPGEPSPAGKPAIKG